MSIAKVIEVIAESGESFDDAVNKGVTEASATIKSVRSIRVNEMTGPVENGKVNPFRVAMKVTFLVVR